MRQHRAFVPSALLALAVTGLTTPALAQEDDDGGDVIVVRGVFVPDEKRDTSEISSLLDAEDFQRSGDSDIASALRRITGISITDGKFPVARGLNERYSSATVNGIPLPSPEPLRRSAPLDLIPTAVLRGSNAQKTFSPQFSGEFGGAAINLETLTVPTENFLKLSIGGSIDTEASFKDGLFYEGSDTDVLGFDDGLRDLPDLARAAANGERVDPGELGKSFDQFDTLLIQGNEVPMNGSGSASGGYVFVDNADLRIGGSLTLGYSNQHTQRDAQENRTRVTTFEDIDNASFLQREDYLETRQEIQFNALGTLGFESGDGNHEVGLTSYLLRSTLKRARQGSIELADVFDGVGVREFTDFVEREVVQNQLNGSHRFPDLSDLGVDWRVAYGEAKRDAPYERTLTRSPASEAELAVLNADGQRNLTEAQLYESFRPNLNEITFSYLDDENVYAGVDFTLPLFVADRELELSWGGAYTDKTRETERLLFQASQFRQSLAGTPFQESRDEILPFLLAARADILYSDDFFDLGLTGFQLTANRDFPNQSDANLEVFAGYGMIDFEVNEYIRVSAGARYEDGEQTAESSLSSDSDGISLQAEPIEEDYILPAVTVTWNPAGNLQLRAGYSQTITRPQFRELVPTIFNDPTFNVELFGNPFLTNSELTNYDLRGELYFRRGEFLTIGAFYKEIENPIERVFLRDEADRTSFVNIPAADLYGVEFEFEKRFELYDYDNMPAFFSDKEIIFNTNYTFSQSEIDADGDVIIAQPGPGGISPSVLDGASALDDGRSLVGQSDHLVNLQIGLENPDVGMRATVLVNWASERILFGAQPGPSGADLPEVIEEPPVSLDFVFARDIDVANQTFSVGAKVQNILGDDFNAFREDSEGRTLPYLEYDRGQVFSLSLSTEF